MTVRVRFAPSPTGFVHIGSLRTALYNFLFAKKSGGKYILRIEDTDQTRLVEGAVEGMLNAMDWAGIHHDEGPFQEGDNVVQRGEYGPYVQSERLPLYKQFAEELLDSGHAYPCFCSKERLDDLRETQKIEGKITRYDGLCRSIPLEEARQRIEKGESHVIRMKLPTDVDISFEDIVRGKVTVNTNDMDDQVLMKADGYPTYHMAVVIDDHAMGITHVIRGEEWLPSTPKHIYLYHAFGWKAPEHVHLPNILNPDKKKLSKRQGDVAVEDFQKKGYLPEALVNYIALLGWSPEGNEEKMSMDEMVEKFSLERVSKSGAVFDVQKLNWMNSLYIKEMPLEMLVDQCMPYFIEKGYVDPGCEHGRSFATEIVRISKDSMDYLAQCTDLVPLFRAKTVEPEDGETLEMMKQPHVVEMLGVFKDMVEAADQVDAAFSKQVFKEVQAATGIKGKALFMPIRAAISGQLHGPEMVDLMTILGKKRIISRVEDAIARLS
ncbi:glutamate--tRNA ligase [Acidaminobacter hydrogenoformans]|uniref:Glutamate--tRNA ligase n=1 Tax=Acidaminobacter hydrogenoformans DSM 2784 TaxID=1120920 RepID=A0A1G5S6G7_9FIRM|nr:glutamate--tRNA ligase [Acidaminobacter hydrogenoformans]SCZ81972.1 nondiscriminating glutamyl-tRNA synthetase [Acidaminobacter hydrogenoformans DSM 2784]